MNHLNFFQTLFVVFAFLSQVLLIFNFAALKWKPALQQKWGWIVYALALITFPLAILFWASRQEWFFWLAFVIFTMWSVFGYIVDILRPVNWREPILPRIFVPYLVLYIAAQFAFWIPLWYIGFGYWIIYAALYTICTVLNVSNHFKAKVPLAR